MSWDKYDFLKEACGEEKEDGTYILYNEDDVYSSFDEYLREKKK